MFKTSRTTRTTGLLIAVALALIGGGVVLYVALGNQVFSGKPAISSNIIDLGKPTDTQADGAGGLGPVQNARIQVARKTDPTQLAAEIVYASLDPLGNGYFALERPQAWLFMRDGRVIHIQAGAGRVKMAGKTQQPESGDLTDGVVLRVFDASVLEIANRQSRGPDAPPFEPAKYTPTLVLYTKTCSFDSVVLELRTEDPVSLLTPDIYFQGDGLLVRGNEVRERIELLRTSGKFVRFNPQGNADAGPADLARANRSPATLPNPGLSDPAATPANSTTTASRANSSANTPAPAATGATAVLPPRETLYRCLISEAVTLTNQTRKLSADTLELWTRLIDNELPAGAIASVLLAERSPVGQAPTPVTTTAPDTDALPDAAATPKPPAGSAFAASPSRAAGSMIGLPTLPGGVPTLFRSAGADDIVLAWTGTLVLTPILAGPADAPPEQLAGGNHFAARFSADKPSGEPFVTLSDPSAGLLGVCGNVLYAATTRELLLTGGAGTPNVAITSPELGRAVLSSAKINLGSGVAQATGAGLLAMLRPEADGSRWTPTPGELAAPGGGTNNPDLTRRTVRQISWRDQADMQLRVINARLSNQFELASFTGGVSARDGASLLAGDFLRAEFASPKMPAGQPQVRGTLVKNLRVTGHVVAVTGPSASSVNPALEAPALDPNVRADQLDVAFNPTPDGRESYPTVANATGNARAITRDAEVQARSLEARLVRERDGKIAWDTITADGSPIFRRNDGVFASADMIRVDARTRAADLTGQLVTIGRGSSRVTGSRIRLEETTGRVIVTGAGAFDHVQNSDPESIADGNPTTPQVEPTRVNVTWSRGMVFDNAAGAVDADGAVTFSSVAPLLTQRASADQIRLLITPASTTPARGTSLSNLPTTAAGGTEPVLDGRRLLRAEAIGASVAKDNAANAKVESYRFARNPDGSKSREQVLYLEGQRIITDEVLQTLSVPTQGYGIMRDERAPVANSASSPAGSSSNPLNAISTVRGTARLTWAGSMSFARTTGELKMLREVELAHVPGPGADSTGARGPLRLVASSIEASFGQPTQELSSAGFANGSGLSGVRGAELRSATASGAVYAETGNTGQQVKLFADRLRYDALNGIADVQADQGNRVSVYDDRRPIPIVARGVKWDLGKDRIEIVEPLPIIAPR